MLSAPALTTTPPRTRIAGLDGIRGLAALYVVAHHCWLLCYPGYPANTGPAWTGWLLHGRLAVVVFITLSGFSLAAAPARDGWRLGGVASYLRRRARRILPPYWAALALSLLVVAFSHRIAERSVLVYGLLLQDFVAAPAPNRAFWSIAVEAGLYLAFPLLLLLRRRAGAVVTLAVVGVPVVAARLIWPAGGGYTWELAPLFTIGMVAAGLRARPWLASLAAAPVLAVIVAAGPVWTVRHYFWIDLAAGPAIAAFLASVAGGRPGFLKSRALDWLGGCSYSLYLIHMPVVALVSRHLVPSHAFLPTVLVAVPASVLAAAAFAAIFERGRYSGTS